MFDKPFALEIVTPERVVYHDTAVSVSAPGVEGSFQVLFSHAPFMTVLEVGRLKVRTAQGEEIVFATSEGFAEVRNNTVVIMVESAERPGEIDVTRAQQAHDRAEARIATRAPDTDIMRAQAALRRATNRLRLAKQIAS